MSSSMFLDHFPDSYWRSVRLCLNNLINKRVEKGLNSTSEDISKKEMQPIIRSLSNVELTKSSSKENYSLIVKIMEGKGIKKTDLLGWSDPFVTIELKNSTQNQIKKTAVKKGTSHPKWAEQFILDCGPFPERETLILKIFDFNYIQTNEFLGEIQIPLNNFKKSPSFVGWEHYFLKGNQKEKGEIMLELKLVKIP